MELKELNRRIDPNKFYSLHQAQRLCRITSREYIVKHINDGQLLAIVLDDARGKTGKRYVIKGEWIISFNKRYRKSVAHVSRYKKMEFKIAVDRIIEYCRENDIDTIEQLQAHTNILT